MKPPLRLLLFIAKFGNTGSLLEDIPALIALGAYDLRNAALSDDGVTVPAQTRIHEQLVDVLEPYILAVDLVFAFPAAKQPPGHADFPILRRQLPLFIVNGQGHRRKTDRLSSLSTGKK